LKSGIKGIEQQKSFPIFQRRTKMEDEIKKRITRRSFLKKGKKLTYLTPVVYTFFTDSKEAFAQGKGKGKGKKGNVRLERLVARLEKQAASKNEKKAAKAQQQLQELRQRLVSPP